ncbi:MAG TPA: glycosyltransferase family 4 protein [Ornithinimicrobium sp.]|uniref:glycosyltransferase family 4 protein n=1 Tax=Ornithinimicrobium sp. TaxID=1977084 RepID=UPI002B4810EA|nr:glycosyltransferase family 4 protein [Ornithinimicrobium sp.]HKJ11795.1 glycosyltransferase family 4 protein [Ornithinimicrobium sp.]
MRVGLVNPYSLDTPGGVQAHVLDLADYLLGVGHQVSVLTPALSGTGLPAHVQWAGSAVAVPYNGSVARLAFGPAVAARVRDWLDTGDFDIVHLHEPASPSVSLLALWAATGPIVATFHSAQTKSRSLRLAGPLLQPALDKISARIAVSEQAHATVVRQLGGHCVVIPNGVDVGRFRAAATSTATWEPGRDEVEREPGRDEAAERGAVSARSGPTLVFLGRFTEPRKGLPVLLQALPRVLEAVPGARLVVAGPGDPAEVTGRVPGSVAARCDFVGVLSDSEKAALLRRADVYLAPNTGGESFGIILVEAMAAGAPVLAADLPAFREVLDDGRSGELFPVADPDALADALLRLLGSSRRRAELARVGPTRAQRYDWSGVGREVLAVYDSVRPPGGLVRSLASPRRRDAGAHGTPGSRQGR